MSLFASAHPERVAKLFLCSPVGFVGVPPAAEYNPYTIRVSDAVNKVPPRHQVDKLVHERENKINAFGALEFTPKQKRAGKFLRMAKAEF